MAERRDAYARLPFQHDRTRRADDTGGGLTFFDVADWATTVETVAGYLRAVPLDLIGRPDWVLARWGHKDQGWTPPEEAADALQATLKTMGSVAAAGVVVFEVAAPPTIVWSHRPKDRTGHEPVLLARARAIEMEAFLDWGHALWHPDAYHYVLPSGKHTSTFIRLADAFQDLRAAPALATWLYGALNPEALTTAVMDIGTLMPVVGELQRAAERHRHVSHSSAGIAGVLSLDRYPSSSLGLHTSLLGISPDSPMLGLMSVSDKRASTNCKTAPRRGKPCWVETARYCCRTHTSGRSWAAARPSARWDPLCNQLASGRANGVRPTGLSSIFGVYCGPTSMD